MTKPPHDSSYEAIKLIARVNELDIKNPDGKKGFKIEVMTGVDAERFILAEKRESQIEFVKDHWWQIGIGLAILWWWLVN
jgi:hypothetical protein